MNSSSKYQLSWISNISNKVSFLYNYFDVRKGAKGTPKKTFIDSASVNKSASTRWR